ncbi:MAG: ROK family protein [Oligoflexus sp.]|nr:ROK family protein [Pseudopedobacter sp.]
MKELVDKYPNEEFTKKIFDEFSEHLSFFLIELATLKSPDCIIIGGNIAKASSFFMESLETKLHQKLGYKLPLLLSVLGENSAIIGAASLFYHLNH